MPLAQHTGRDGGEAVGVASCKSDDDRRRVAKAARARAGFNALRSTCTIGLFLEHSDMIPFQGADMGSIPWPPCGLPGRAQKLFVDWLDE